MNGSSWTHATSPVRIDLAGGTLDIWPLYLLHPEAVTINLAILPTVEARVRALSGRRYRVTSKDGRKTVTAQSARKLPSKGPLALASECLRYFDTSKGLEVETQSNVPAGSGLGASSALNVAILAAFRAHLGSSRPRREIVPLARDIEARLLRTSTGIQDYVSALYGGLNALHWMPGEPRRERLPLPSFLRKGLVTVFSGKSHQSGVTNWDVVRSRMDRDRQVRRCLDGLARTSHDMYDALRCHSLSDTAACWNEEWKLRVKLAPGWVTPKLQKLADVAREAGALASKVCGAGGGGTLVSLAPERLASRVRESLEEVGGSTIAHTPYLQGVRVRKG